MKNTPHIPILLFILFWFTTIYAKEYTSRQIDSIFSKSKEIQFSNIDSSIHNFEICFRYYVANNDSQNIIETSKILRNQYSGKGEYLKAYDITWQTFPYLQSPNFSSEKIEFYHGLASLYLIYGQFPQADKYLKKALYLVETKIEKPDDKNRLMGKLYNLEAWLVNEWKGDLQRAEEMVLKSKECYSRLPNVSFELDFADLHLSKLYIKMNRLDEAAVLLHVLEEKYSEGNQPILSLLYYDLGTLYMAKKEYSTTINYYKLSIDEINQHQNHLDKKVEIFEKLAECYHAINQNDLAYRYSRKAKELSESLFGSMSAQNQQLFEIRDVYELQLQEKQKEIQAQKLVILEREKEIWTIRGILYGVVLILLIAVVFVLFKQQAKKHKNKQIRWKIEHEKERQKQKEIIENKNVEIMASALKLLERDQTLDEIKKRIKDINTESPDVKKEILTSIQTNKSQIWDAFDLHFTSANKNFNRILKAKHPNLSPTEAKICAFIQMGLSSKDMAHLMNIGVSGLNTSRSRIRKKMNLDRSTNLTDYLQSIERIDSESVS